MIHKKEYNIFKDGGYRWIVAERERGAAGDVFVEVAECSSEHLAYQVLRALRGAVK